MFCQNTNTVTVVPIANTPNQLKTALRLGQWRACHPSARISNVGVSKIKLKASTISQLASRCGEVLQSPECNINVANSAENAGATSAIAQKRLRCPKSVMSGGRLVKCAKARHATAISIAFARLNPVAWTMLSPTRRLATILPTRPPTTKIQSDFIRRARSSASNTALGSHTAATRPSTRARDALT